ncbi:MAG: ligand-binding protein SH3 [Elusimicrobia bacterium CG02_land_8_20_14_3_00_37_13]|nr:MAG: ligand-binding protein SH3 [Elusimicrobia bacterium CG02_land_8_20_14_3_00_37_13]
MENIIKFLESLLGKSPELMVFLLGALPVSELRGAIPLGIAKFGFSIQKTFIIAVIGNLVPVIPLLLFLNYLSKELSKISILGKFFDWWFTRTKKRSKIIEEYGTLGLILFVAIPLPMTGAWSGCVASYLLGMRLRYAFPAIALGVIIAGIVVTLTTVGIIKIF